ncbi:MAG: hypothetical protein HFJ28_05560 [Clostridia bacterium]|jgi:hypothetical protein|nr:hypothetical protein [Clostridia bacterium]
MNILMNLSILLVLGLVIWLIYEGIMQAYYDTLRYETFSDTAKVCSKKYEEEYITTKILPVGKVMVPQIHCHDEEYNVYLMYRGEKHCFNNKDLYNLVNIGDSVCILVHKGYNKKNELKNVYLSVKQ